jgi:hypothetical protein
MAQNINKITIGNGFYETTHYIFGEDIGLWK